MSTYRSLEDINSSSQIVQPFSNNCWTSPCRRYRRTNKCVSSKAALLILIWIFLTHFMVSPMDSALKFVFQTIHESAEKELPVYTKGTKILNKFLIYVYLLRWCFYPISGFLADVKFGRFKTVVWSICLLLITLIISAITILILLILLWTINSMTVQNVLVYLLIIIALVAFIVYSTALVAFDANFIQFGIDQLYESPLSHQSLFIYWYLWSIAIATVTSRSAVSTLVPLTDRKYILILFIPILISLTVSVIIALRKRRWFLVDSNQQNPYGLVYKVTKFALTHKIPIRRSAFTYCEDEIPSVLDLAKSKYGGPFTIEEVEDVKAFYGIFKVLLSLGPIFGLHIAVSYLDVDYHSHLPSDKQIHSILQFVALFGVIPDLLTVINIPVYICLIRPLIYNRLPGMLKRIGLGIIAMLAALLCTFSLDTATHTEYPDMECLLTDIEKQLNNNTFNGDIYTYHYLILFQYSFSSVSTMLFRIALFEFICSQSPNSMKGMLIGVSFAIKGIFQIVFYSILSAFALIHSSFPTCGMYLYLMNISVCTGGFFIFVIVAKRYQFRKRDEICPVYQYAEEYYSRNIN